MILNLMKDDTLYTFDGGAWCNLQEVIKVHLIITNSKLLFYFFSNVSFLWTRFSLDGVSGKT